MHNEGIPNQDSCRQVSSSFMTLDARDLNCSHLNQAPQQAESTSSSNKGYIQDSKADLVFVELPVDSLCGQHQSEGLSDHLNRYRKSVWEDEPSIQGKVSRQVRTRKKSLQLNRGHLYKPAGTVLVVVERTLFPCDQEHGKGAALSAFSTPSKSAIRKFQEIKCTYITEEEVKPSLFADQKKKKKVWRANKVGLQDPN